jgi:hypothetical protein
LPAAQPGAGQRRQWARRTRRHGPSQNAWPCYAHEASRACGGFMGFRGMHTAPRVKSEAFRFGPRTWWSCRGRRCGRGLLLRRRLLVPQVAQRAVGALRAYPHRAVHHAAGHVQRAQRLHVRLAQRPPQRLRCYQQLMVTRFRSFPYPRTTVRSPRKLDRCLTLWHPINSTFGLIGSWFGPLAIYAHCEHVYVRE